MAYSKYFRTVILENVDVDNFNHLIEEIRMMNDRLLFDEFKSEGEKRLYIMKRRCKAERACRMIFRRYKNRYTVPRYKSFAKFVEKCGVDYNEYIMDFFSGSPDTMSISTLTKIR